MLIVKIQLPNGLEDITETKTVRYSATHNSLSFDNGYIEIPPDSVAFVMSAGGETISRYEYLNPVSA
ncbi:hypothetical protein [Serratia bockelmannii]|uniref:hypothetical protein n=1 Tax=Serratia bockelmannii TaxID=2703793 RepID=UPI003FA79F12